MSWDANSFLNRIDALGVLGQSCRAVLTSDSYVGGRATFDAVVLSDPLPLSTANASIYFGTPSAPPIASVSGIQGLLRKAQASVLGTAPATLASQLGDTSNKFVFKGRVEAIAGRPSQHCWYPDPCALDFAANAEYASKIIGLHTTFISLDDHSNNSTIKLPRAGDKVVVELMMIPGSNPPQFDTTFGYYKGILSDASTDGTQIATATSCQRIASLFNGAGGTFGGYLSGSTPAPPASDTGQIPVTGRFSSPFGMRSSWTNRAGKTFGGRMHWGIDIARNNGRAVRPVNPGTVSFAGWYGGGGNAVKIKHADGSISTYMHLMSINCKVGDVVTLNSLIGKVGNTGNSDGAHLHFEIRNPAGQKVDAIVYFGWQPYLTPDTKGKLWFRSTGDTAPVAETTCAEGKEWWPAGEYLDGSKYDAGCYKKEDTSSSEVASHTGPAVLTPGRK